MSSCPTHACIPGDRNYTRRCLATTVKSVTWRYATQCHGMWGVNNDTDISPGHEERFGLNAHKQRHIYTHASHDTHVLLSETGTHMARLVCVCGMFTNQLLVIMDILDVSLAIFLHLQVLADGFLVSHLPL